MVSLQLQMYQVLLRLIDILKPFFFPPFLPYLIVNQNISAVFATRPHDSLSVIATFTFSFSISVLFGGTASIVFKVTDA